MDWSKSANETVCGPRVDVGFFREFFGGAGGAKSSSLSEPLIKLEPSSSSSEVDEYPIISSDVRGVSWFISK
jgi:hypothetical protein